MKLVIFGLTLSSSWGNGHATLWRGLIRALDRRGHRVVFFERNVPYYAAHRDLTEIDGARLILYDEWRGVSGTARCQIEDADAVVITSYCPDAIGACAELFSAPTRALRVFYDLDTPVTLARILAGEPVEYIPAEGLKDFDLVLSYTGGTALHLLKQHLGANAVAPLYGHVDPLAHHPLPARNGDTAALSYLGTYAADRQPSLLSLFVSPARMRPALRFELGGSGYPVNFPWQTNIWFRRHVAPARHPEFFASARLTLNITRADMAACGFCPSGRIFEAAACGTPIVSDAWEGLDTFFTPGEQILVARSTAEVLEAIDSATDSLARIGDAARERVLAEHTSEHRARQLIDILGGARPCGA
jgi:spore maturation protein CgeB